MRLNEGDKYDDPVFVNAEILSHFKKEKQERDCIFLAAKTCIFSMS